MNIFYETFSTGQVTKAANITNAALQNWIRRGLIVGQGEGVDMPGQPGKRRAFTFFNVVEIAVAAALIEAGVDLRQAFQAAAGFAHTGVQGRNPGVPFNDDGKTLIFVAGDRSVELSTADPDFYQAAMHLLLEPLTMTVLDVSSLFDRAVVKLGVHPQAVIDASYELSAD